MNRRLVLFTPGHVEPGGAQRRSLILARGLAERGWDVRVVTRAGSIRRPRIKRNERLTVVEVPGFGNRLLGALLFLLVALPLGLVWGVGATAFVSLQLMSTSTVAATCALILRKPFLALSTTTGRLSEVDYLRSTRTWPLRRRLLGRASVLISQTEGARGPLTALVPASRIEVLGNPVVVPVEAPPLNNRPTAAYAGRLSSEKNLSMLLDAWLRVKTEIPAAHLTLFGEGGDFRSVEADLRRKVESNPVLDEAVSMPGWVDDSASAIAGHDVFVLPSREEGMSNALLEACALGRVIVASDIPSNRSVLGDEYPFLFPQSDENGLSSALLDALDAHDEQRNRARELARERAVAFSAAVIVERLEELINATHRARH